MEALLNEIPAIAFSEERGGSGAAADTHLLPVVRKLLAKQIAKDEIWNVNFPGCPPEELQGIRENRIPDRIPFYYVLLLCQLKPANQIFQSFRLCGKLLACCRSLFRSCGVALYDTGNLLDSLLDLL